jgi:hypothetical protein
MGENVLYTSYLSQKEHGFIKKCNFCDNLTLLKKLACQCKGLKTPHLEKYPDWNTDIPYILSENTGWKTVSRLA